MKQFKTLVALVLALALTLTLVGAAFATSTFAGTADTTITATNLDSGDTVYYIQLVEWDGTYAGTADTNKSGWKLTANGTTAGVSLPNLLDGIDATEAATIAANLASVNGTAMTTTDTTATADVAPGLYYLRAVAQSDDTIYNPAFVSADYYTNDSNTVSFNDTIGDSAVLKKSTVVFDKQTGHGTDAGYTYNDVKPGDIIPYQISTQIPAYGAAYDDAVFTVSDTFSAGLQLVIDADHAFTVTYGDASGNQQGVTDVYTCNAANEGSSFTVDFAKAYLLGASRGVTSVTITYYGKVTTAAPANVNPLDNTASLHYTNAPEETNDKHDITRHYTFSIDGKLLGNESTWTKELLKVGLDKQGNVIEETKTTVHEKEISPLAGASFTLTPVAGTGAGFGTSTVGTVDSSADGRLEFHGLDAGVYSLVENSAPTGFVKDSTTYYIKINPSYTGDILDSYTIQWSTDQTNWTDITTFELNNTGSSYEEKVTSSDPDDGHAAVQNRQGSELPSTGGIGTTIFYVAGIVLVLGAAAIIIARRKAEQ